MLSHDAGSSAGCAASWPVDRFANANVNFKNMDKIIHYVNLDGRVNAFYSTPAGAWWITSGYLLSMSGFIHPDIAPSFPHMLQPYIIKISFKSPPVVIK